MTKELLSGSDGGAGIPINSIGGIGTLIHASDASARDALHVWLSNRDGSGQTVSMLVGGEPAMVTIPGLTTVLAVPGWLLSSGKELRIVGDKAGAVSAFGFVERHAA
jgi:hypothetical protein